MKKSMLLTTAALVGAAVQDDCMTATPFIPRTPGPAPPAPLVNKYEVLQNATCAKVVPHIPVLHAPDADNFMALYQKFNGSGTETAVLAAAQKLLSNSDVTKFLNLPDSFVGGGLDADMVKCAVLVDATPTTLATFAAQGKEQEALVDALLEDIMLMRDMLVAGGATAGLYGEAMDIYQQILKKSSVLTPRSTIVTADSPWDDRTQDKQAILHRLALGTAVELAMPLPLHFPTPRSAPWGPMHAGGDGKGNVDPIARYLNMEKAFLNGDLDPRFEVLTVFEQRQVQRNPASEEDIAWMRQTMANFRPDYIEMNSTKRYSQSVHTEIAEGTSPVPCPYDVCTGRYAQLPVTGGVCGIRAFWTRNTRRAFGMPVWGFTERGHAALSTWNPSGWGVQLGASWQFGYWNKRGVNEGGSDFYLDTQTRELRAAYQTVLRSEWAARARFDAPIDHSWSSATNEGYGVGGLWSALSLYNKKLTVTGATIPTRVFGPPVVPNKIAALVARWPTPEPIPNITVDSQGTIHIPAVAFSWKNKSTRVSIVKSFDEGSQLMYSTGDWLDPSASSVSYTVTAESDATYFLTANHTTWHTNQDLLLTTNTSGSTPLTVPVYYTVGYWNESQSVAVKLLKGTNVLTFSRRSSSELVFKNFNLYVKEPSIKAPPANYTPVLRPPPDKYKEEPATTSCKLQGITSVTEEFCGDACAAIGGTYTGARSTESDLTGSGCYTLVSGPYKGNCNYFKVANPTCTKPPCGVFAELCSVL